MSETLQFEDLEANIERLISSNVNFTVENLTLKKQRSAIKIIEKVAKDNQMRCRFYLGARWDIVRLFLSFPFVMLFTGLSKGRLESAAFDFFWILGECSIGIALFLILIIILHELGTHEIDYEIRKNYKTLTAIYIETHFKESS